MTETRSKAIVRLHALWAYLSARRELFAAAVGFARQTGRHGTSRGWRTRLIKSHHDMVTARRTMRLGRVA